MKTAKSFLIKDVPRAGSNVVDGDDEDAEPPEDEETRPLIVVWLMALVENKYFAALMTMMTIYALFGDGACRRIVGSGKRRCNTSLARRAAGSAGGLHAPACLFLCATSTRCTPFLPFAQMSDWLHSRWRQT